MSDGSPRDRLRRLPPVDRVVDAIAVTAPRSVIVAAARTAIDEARRRVRSGEDAPSLEEIASLATDEIGARERKRLQPVVNATGVLVHTNLGRVPLSTVQIAAVERIAGSYSNLEYDLVAGERGSRLSHLGELLAEVTGAEAGLVVNNNAAAILLALAGLCGGREVVISRGELVEIGGEFRIPEVMEVAGARLVEVGTTNRTRLRDYEEAVTSRTAAILKVHPSNYQMIGFTASVQARELVRLAASRGLALINDLGSGLATTPGDPSWIAAEPRVADAVADGADVITFSGDKLLGGPQAGLIVGRRESIEKLARHALIRALRVDKMTLAALEVTLDLHRQGRAEELPLWAMAGSSPAQLERRSQMIVESMGPRVPTEATVHSVPLVAVTGGGSLPGSGIESHGLSVESTSTTAAEIERNLRRGDPPVIARIEGGRVVLDLRTVAAADDEALADLVIAALNG